MAGPASAGLVGSNPTSSTRPRNGGEKSLLELVRTGFSWQSVLMVETTMAPRGEQTMAEHGVTVVHIRFEGKSLDIPQGDLDVGAASSDNEIKRALARHLEVPEAKLRDYVIDRHDTGNMTVRPEAVFG